MDFPTHPERVERSSVLTYSERIAGGVQKTFHSENRTNICCFPSARVKLMTRRQCADRENGIGWRTRVPLRPHICFRGKKTKTLWIQSGILQGLSLCVFVCVGGSKGITSPVHLCVHVYTSGRGRVGGGREVGGGVRLKQGQNSASSPLHSLLPLTLIELHTRTVLRRVRFLHDLISNVHPQQTSTSLSPPVQRKIQI